MNPEDLCQLSIKPDTAVSLVSLDYGGVEWSYEKRVKGTLQSCLVLERHHPATSGPKETWDTAARVALPVRLQATEDGEAYSGKELLLLQRTPNSAWDDEGGPVWVFGIRPEVPLGAGPLRRVEWRPKTILLSYGATLLVEDASTPSLIARAFQENYELKKLKALHEAGGITAHAYALQRAEIISRFRPSGE
jgi:hypothetical protein